MKKLNQGISIFLFALSIVICWASVKLGIGEFRNPGTGFMPFFTSSLLFFLSMGVLLKSFIKKVEGEDKKSLIVRENLKKPVILVIGLIGYTFFLKIFGYLITTSLLIFLMFFIFDSKVKNSWKHFVIGIIASTLSFLIFCKWLQVDLPAGIFHIRF